MAVLVVNRLKMVNIERRNRQQLVRWRPVKFTLEIVPKGIPVFNTR